MGAGNIANESRGITLREGLGNVAPEFRNKLKIM